MKLFKINSKQDFDDLYNVIIDGFKNMPKNDIILETPNEYIWLNYKKFLGKTYIRFFSTSKSEYIKISFTKQYSERQINMLYEKNNKKSYNFLLQLLDQFFQIYRNLLS